MMKKLLVLALVLGIAGMASAALSINKTAPDKATLEGADYIVDSGVPQFAGAYIGLTVDAVDYSVAYMGNQWSVTDLTADLAGAFEGIVGVPVAKVLWFDFADTTPLPNTKLPNGALVHFTATAASTVWVLDAADASIVGSANLVPEPASMLLLGLGGLFLRRRK